MQTQNLKIWRYRCPYLLHEGMEGSRSLAPLMLNLALDGAEWSNSRPAALTPGNNHRREGSLDPKLVWTIWREKMLSTLPGCGPRSSSL